MSPESDEKKNIIKIFRIFYQRCKLFYSRCKIYSKHTFLQKGFIVKTSQPGQIPDTQTFDIKDSFLMLTQYFKNKYYETENINFFLAFNILTFVCNMSKSIQTMPI